MPFTDIFPQGDATQRQELASPARAGKGGTLSTSLEGLSGVYRLGFQSMEVPGIPTDVVVGSASVMQTVGPVRTQTVSIKQQPGFEPVFEKQMSHHEVGHGLPLTVCQLPIVVPPAQSLGITMATWRDEALAAIGLLVFLLDERIAQQQILEDVVVFDEQGGPFAALDVRRRIRTFQSSNIVMKQHRDAIAQLQAVDLSANDPGLGAVRWYLRAAQTGPVPDSVVLFWIALEALTRPATAGKSWDEVKGVEEALRQTGLGIDPRAHIQPTVGRLYGLRADVVHKGMENPPLLREGYYTLEMIVRLLLRHHFGTGKYAWPARVGEPNLRPEFQNLLRDPRTRWND